MKKILALVLAITTVFALAIPAMAAGDTHVFVDCNATFHCGGRVWPDVTAYQVTDSKGKTTTSLPVTRVGSSTTWKLDDSKGEIECPACGRTDWVTFSNNSGVPNGNNPQFDHDPSMKLITVEVVYHIEIPKCSKVTCKYAKLTCKFKCDGCACPYTANFLSHGCNLKCFSGGHDCPIANFKPCDPVKDCACDKNKTESVYKKQLLIPISGYLFTYDTAKTWEGGFYVSGGKPISETITKSTTFDVFYKGYGKCKCKCDKPVCDVKCVPCTFKPTCNHKGIVCDNCKNGNGNNHKNCEFDNPNATSNYFCMACNKKVGALKWDKKTNIYSWEPADKGANAWTPVKSSPNYLPICECKCAK